MGRYFVFFILINSKNFCQKQINARVGNIDDHFLLILKGLIPEILSGMIIFMFSDLVSKKLGLLSISKITAGKMRDA